MFQKRRNITFTILLLKKENEIYRRHLNLQNKKLQFRKNDKLSLAMIIALSKKAINHLTLVKPETLLNWQSRFIKSFWSYQHKIPGRDPVIKEVKKLILEMKQENYLWGCKKIADELKKINIDIHYTTVNRIISTFRKQGLIQPMDYYNQYRPHQGIDSILEDRPPDISGKIKKMPILFGLHHHYYRAS
jgi:putative transposase